MSVYERVLAENTELARTLAIKESSQTLITSGRHDNKRRRVVEDDSTIRTKSVFGGASARSINNNLDWLCKKCGLHNFARVVICIKCGDTVEGATYITGQLKARRRYEQMMRLSRN